MCVNGVPESDMFRKDRNIPPPAAAAAAAITAVTRTS